MVSEDVRSTQVGRLRLGMRNCQTDGSVAPKRGRLARALLFAGGFAAGALGLVGAPEALAQDSSVAPREESAAPGATLGPGDFDGAVYLSVASVGQVARASGFLRSQAAATQAMKEQHSSRALHYTLRENAFAARFGRSVARVDELLRAVTGDAYGSEMAEMEPSLQAIRERSYSDEEARGFLAELDGRLEGRIDPDTLSTLLWLTYVEEPSDEMRDAWTTRFSTAGHAKPLGLDVSLDVPLPWGADEGDRPHIVQKWISQGGTGLDTIILHMDEAPVPPVSMEEVRLAADIGQIAGMVPDGFRFLGGSATAVDGLPTIQYDFVGERANPIGDVVMASRSFVIFSPSATIMLTCQVGRNPAQESEALERLFAVGRLCDRIAATLVVAQTYATP